MKHMKALGFGDKVLDKCEMERCALFAFQTCLKHWFETRPDSKDSFNCVFSALPLPTLARPVGGHR